MIERYSLPEMAAIWDEEVKLALWVRIEVEAVKAWAELGKVPTEAAARIEENASLDIARMQETRARRLTTTSSPSSRRWERRSGRTRGTSTSA